MERVEGGDVSRGVRILIVTTGLILGGAIFGGMAGVVAFHLVEVLDGRPVFALNEWIAIPAYLGAALGAVACPLGAWLMMRHVPIGTGIVGGTVGAIAGAAASLIIPWWENEIARSLVGGVIGFLVAALILRRRAQTAVPS
jgi:hypothetical protein